jgi:hypothetical protein
LKVLLVEGSFFQVIEGSEQARGKAKLQGVMESFYTSGLLLLGQDEAMPEDGIPGVGA